MIAKLQADLQKFTALGQNPESSEPERRFTWPQQEFYRLCKVKKRKLAEAWFEEHQGECLGYTSKSKKRQAMHLIAEHLWSHLMLRIISVDEDQASVTTKNQVSMGGWTPLHCVAELALADYDKTGRTPWYAWQCGQLLVQHMTKEAIMQTTNKDANFLHLAASRGNDQWLKDIIPEVQKRLGKEDCCARSGLDSLIIRLESKKDSKLYLVV